MAQDNSTVRVTRNITLDPETDALVVAKKDELIALTGDDNYSAAVRFIVREWANYTKLPRRTTTPTAA